MSIVREPGHAPACSTHRPRNDGRDGEHDGRPRDCDCSVQRVAELERLLLGLRPKRERPLILLDVDGVFPGYGTVA